MRRRKSAKGRRSARSIRLVDYDATGDMQAEAYRMLWLQIQTQMAQTSGSTFLMTSSLAQEGKTSVSSNLGVIAGISGTRTLILDADLRKPMIHRAFELPSSPGLVDVILGKCAPEEAVRRTLIPNLSVVPAGNAKKRFAEILGSPRCGALIQAFQEQYELVLVDSPPISLVSDAGALVRVVDGIYLVIRAGETPTRIVTNAHRTLRDLGGNVLGAVLSRIDLSRERHYYSGGYPYYYSTYYRETEAEDPPLEPDGVAERG